MSNIDSKTSIKEVKEIFTPATVKEMIGVEVSQSKIDELLKDYEKDDEYSQKQTKAKISDEELQRQNQERTANSKFDEKSFRENFHNFVKRK